MIIHFIQTPTAPHTKWEDIVEKIVVSCCFLYVYLGLLSLLQMCLCGLEHTCTGLTKWCQVAALRTSKSGSAFARRSNFKSLWQRSTKASRMRTCIEQPLVRYFPCVPPLHRLVGGKQHRNEKTHLDAGWHSVNRSLSHPKHRTKTCTYRFYIYTNIKIPIRNWHSTFQEAIAEKTCLPTRGGRVSC